DAQITLITEWIDGGAPAGDANQYQPPVRDRQGGLSRVDVRLAMPVAYTPRLSPDDYRCFILDWPMDALRYVTGFRASPGRPSVVHHVIAFLAPPDQVAAYEELDAREPGAGYTCFGGPGGPGIPGWIGAWAPGSQGEDFPAGTGLPIRPGSKVILQVHY